ncbi:SIR2 family protein [Desulfuribacillus alkaliarsenatis]|uniref:Uncharacterized protein n=1 Tax=Desulfuribacillus alkaliarsenatis TaxID=766136 RepID=A0A1E5G694_9FIRM|nr:SIR2 family protein [Desulfuribacillus alkaliarsenatis]OEF98274.1 hypothetical protein BHF68_00905 [Desulfuribacillus alkaliarsenatis]
MRVTAFLGAGASIEIGGPLAKDLTQEVRSTTQKFIDFKTKLPIEANFIDNVSKLLDTYYAPDICNFEEIFHVLEMLDSYSSGWEPTTVKEYKPALGAFVSPRDNKWFNQHAITVSKHDLIKVVADRIYSYVDKYEPKGEHSWFASFWRKAIQQYSWDICTLNYDDCVQQSLETNDFEDGYLDIGEIYSRFDPSKLLTKKTRLLQLHGSIFYGYPNFKDPNEYIFEDNFEDLYKFTNYENAKKTWFGRSTNTSQSHEQATVGPIITGLKKTDKLLTYPFSTYSYNFQKALAENSSLLIAGYSFGDMHFNRLLERMVRLHGDKRRIVIITYCDEKSWHIDPTVMDWINHEMFCFIAKSFLDADPFKSYEFKSPVLSSDGNVMLFLQGFKDAIQNYEEDILDFLIPVGR